MRLPADRVKQAILHPDRDVRDAAVSYFSEAYSSDVTVMPLVIRAIERYGFEEAFPFHFFMTDLAQSDETVRWLIQQIAAVGPLESDKGGHSLDAFTLALVHADASVLRPHEEAILRLEALDEENRDAIAERIHFLSRSRSRLWEDLEDFCAENEDEESVSDEELAYAGRLVEALGRHSGALAEHVLAVLAGETGDLDNWMEGFAARLAGLMRLEAAIPWLVDMLDDSDDWLHEESHEALVKIGSDAVVARLAQDYPQASWNKRMSSSYILGDVHSDRSVATCFDLLAGEPVHDIRCLLLQAILANFATEGIEPARRFLLESPLDPDALEVRTALLTACKLMGETFPELAAWQEDTCNEQEIRRKWYEEHPPSFSDEDDLDEDFDLDDPDEEESDEDDEEEAESEMPAWLSDLVENVAGVMPTSAPGPIGLRFREEEGTWEIVVYPLGVELIGGAHDGSVVSPEFSLDLEQVRSLFTRIDALVWQAHSLLPEESPYVSIEGEYRQHEVWLRILAFAPDDEKPGMKFDTTGRT